MVASSRAARRPAPGQTTSDYTKHRIVYSTSTDSITHGNKSTMTNRKEGVIGIFRGTLLGALSSYGRFPKFHRVFSGRDPGTLKSDIVSTKTSTIDLFGFETLKYKIRRLNLWKPTVSSLKVTGTRMAISRRDEYFPGTQLQEAAAGLSMIIHYAIL